MARINYKKLKKNVPNKVHVAPKSFYEVLYIDGFHTDTPDGHKTFGETRFEPQQIVLNNNQPDREAVFTFWHEFAHAMSEEYETNLTEKQVISVEKWFPAVRELILKLEGIEVKKKLN